MKAGEIWKSKETGEEVKIFLIGEHVLHKIVIYEIGGVSKVDFDKDFYAKFEKVSESDFNSLMIDITHELAKRVKHNCTISSTASIVQVISNRPTSGRDEIHSFLITKNTHTGKIEVKDFNDSEILFSGSIVNLNKEDLVEMITERVNNYRDLKISHLKARIETLEGFGFY